MSASDTSSSSWMCLWQKSLRTLMNAASNSWSVYLQITTHHDNLRPSCQITFCHSLSFATCGMLPAGGLRLPCIHQVPCGPGKMQESVCDICLSYACKAANKMHCFTAYNTPLVLSIADPSSDSIDTFLLACCTLFTFSTKPAS